MSRRFVQQIRDRDQVDSTFLVREKNTAMAKNGKPYMTLKLMDRTGEIEGRVWDRVDDFGRIFEKDDFIRVRGKASLYLGKMQLVVQELGAVPEEDVVLSDFLPVAPTPVEQMQQELTRTIEGLSDENLRALMKSFVDDPDFYRGYCSAPAGKSMHHAYLGGLLEHSLSVAALARDICARYPELNRDLLVVGALLHDAGKVAELCYRRSFDYTDIGKLVGHIVLGVEMLEDKIRTLPGFPPSLKMLLKHMLLSHHGQYEYGSPKRPKTLEAVALNYLDDMDSKINGVLAHMQKEPDAEAPWTGYHRFYERYFYRGGNFESLKPSAAPAPEAAQPDPALAAEPLPEKPKTERPKGKGSSQRRDSFSSTLGDQFKDMNLNLFPTTDNRE